jgi:hypothetical protein
MELVKTEVIEFLGLPSVAPAAGAPKGELAVGCLGFRARLKGDRHVGRTTVASRSERRPSPLRREAWAAGAAIKAAGHSPAPMFGSR